MFDYFNWINDLFKKVVCSKDYPTFNYLIKYEA